MSPSAAKHGWRTVWRRHRIAALPQEHGAWVFLFSPLFIGLAAGGWWSPGVPWLVLGALAAFLVRQPLTLWVKVRAGRRPPQQARLAWRWTMVYLALGGLALAGLLALGNAFVLWLALPGLPVFVWHLALVARRAERRQIGVEIVASGVLALSAPAAYWVARGGYHPWGWWLWALTWMQSAASIVYAYLRLAQRGWSAVPPVGQRLRAGWRALLYAGFNLVLSFGLAARGVVPWGVGLAYAVQAVETLWGTLRPAVGVRPSGIGLRQFVVSTLFTVLFILAL